jgi:hypothetical protein
MSHEGDDGKRRLNDRRWALPGPEDPEDPEDRVQKSIRRAQRFRTGGIAVLAAALLATLSVIIFRQPSQRVTVVRLGPPLTPGGTATASPLPTPTATLPTTRNPTPSAPAFEGGPVPTGFLASSVSFPTADLGWALGSSCATSTVGILETVYGGKSWASLPAPDATLVITDRPGSQEVSRIRFSDAKNGWVYGPSLWETHDGGAHWAPSTLPGAAAGSSVTDVEASAGLVTAVLTGANSGVQIETSRVNSEAWQLSPTTIPFGPGPVELVTVVLNGSTGWVVANNRSRWRGSASRRGLAAMAASLRECWGSSALSSLVTF